MADGVQTAAVTNLTAALAQQIPGATPTALSAAVSQALAATPQSPLQVQAAQALAVINSRAALPPPPAPSHKPLIFGIAGGAVGLGLLAWFLMRRGKKRR